MEYRAVCLQCQCLVYARVRVASRSMGLLATCMLERNGYSEGVYRCYSVRGVLPEPGMGVATASVVFLLRPMSAPAYNSRHSGCSFLMHPRQADQASNRPHGERFKGQP
jgi:hypothetical protein